MNISENGLDVIRKLIIDKDVEACGFLLEQPNTAHLQVYIDTYGTNIGNRGSCQHRKYTKYIWHTHPVQLIAYPSPEDILKIIKRRDDGFPIVSVVFSKWGTWELFSEKKINLDTKWIDYFVQKLNQVSYKLYVKTDKGRGFFNNTDINDFIQSVKSIINDKLHIGFDLRFTSW